MGFIHLYAFWWREIGGLLTEGCQLNWVFMDIKKDFIEQNDHLWCIWDLLECQQKKILKGKAIYYIIIIHYIISLFLTIVSQLPAWNLGFMFFVCGALSSDNHMVCFRRKVFFVNWHRGWINKKLSIILMYYTCIYMTVKYLYFCCLNSMCFLIVLMSSLLLFYNRKVKHFLKTWMSRCSKAFGQSCRIIYL